MDEPANERPPPLQDLAAQRKLDPINRRIWTTKSTQYEVPLSPLLVFITGCVKMRQWVQKSRSCSLLLADERAYVVRERPINRDLAKPLVCPFPDPALTRRWSLLKWFKLEIVMPLERTIWICSEPSILIKCEEY